MTAATTSISRFWKYWRPIFEALKNSSWAPTRPTREESLIMAMNSLPVGGMITLTACGSTMRRIVCARVMPSACAASTCPCPTDWMPARKISAMYAP